jgi:3D (Asp-Asp-Asp) domain-containing protein
MIEMTATAYIATGHPTRSGRMPQVGRTVAVDESIIPLGSIVVVDGREYVAEDTGRLIRGDRLDIFMASRHDAINFGRRLVQVEVEK